MRSPFIALVLALACVPADAQDVPKRVKTETIRTTGDRTLTVYDIDPDGIVRIDWDAVQKVAEMKVDDEVLSVVRVMLAIRDGTWKPMR